MKSNYNTQILPLKIFLHFEVWFNKLCFNLPIELKLNDFDRILIYDLWGKSVLAKHLNEFLVSKVQLYVKVKLII